jgi:hypothetical protein
MNLEITPKNKLKFFSQYWEQDVLSLNEHATMFLDAYTILSIKESDSLLLSPLSETTDEDVIQIMKWKLSEPHIEKRPNFEQLIRYTRKCIVEESYAENRHCADFLRSKGYALPFMGLSVEEMVKAGWITLTT